MFSDKMISFNEIPYQSCYCEENIFKFLEKLENIDDYYAVFISNNKQMIPLWSQKSAKTENEPVIWDYHVISIKKEKKSTFVFDMDSKLKWPQDFQTYWNETIQPNIQIHSELRRQFRVIRASIFLKIFSSNRNHMKNKDGSWKMPPPKWSIINSDLESNLMSLIDMSIKIENTQIFNENDFYSFFS